MQYSHTVPAQMSLAETTISDPVLARKGCGDCRECAFFLPAPTARSRVCECHHTEDCHKPCLLSKAEVLSHPMLSDVGNCPACGLDVGRHVRLCGHFGGRVTSGPRIGEPCRNPSPIGKTRCVRHPPVRGHFGGRKGEPRNRPPRSGETRCRRHGPATDQAMTGFLARISPVFLSRPPSPPPPPKSPPWKSLSIHSSFDDLSQLPPIGRVPAALSTHSSCEGTVDDLSAQPLLGRVPTLRHRRPLLLTRV